jgi:hypothetical protein
VVTVRFSFLIAAVALIGIGGFMYPPLDGYLREDDKRPVDNRKIYWQRARFTPEGQRRVTRAWTVQGLGLALFVLLALLS